MEPGDDEAPPPLEMDDVSDTQDEFDAYRMLREQYVQDHASELLTVGQLAELLSIGDGDLDKRQAVLRARSAGRIFGISHGGIYRYPRWQISQSGEPLPVVQEILGLFDLTPDDDAWRLVFWLDEPHALLSGFRPIDCLIQGEHRRVCDVARASLCWDD